MRTAKPIKAISKGNPRRSTQARPEEASTEATPAEARPNGARPNGARPSAPSGEELDLHQRPTTAPPRSGVQHTVPVFEPSRVPRISLKSG
jgi:hypothetical protein